MTKFDELSSGQNTRVVSDRVDPHIWTQLASIPDGDQTCVKGCEAVTSQYTGIASIV